MRRAAHIWLAFHAMNHRAEELRLARCEVEGVFAFSHNVDEAWYLSSREAGMCEEFGEEECAVVCILMGGSCQEEQYSDQ